jgi:Ribbon-helix-helix domain
MATFTSSLPEALLLSLEEKARQLSVPKNKLIERALSLYLDQLNRAEYVRSYRQMADDTDMLNLAEEGMSEYLKQLPDEPLL